MGKPERALVERLVDALGGRLEHGRDFGGDFTHNDLRIEVHVSVRRVLPPAERRAHEHAALAHFQEKPWETLRCDVDVNQDAGRSVFNRRYRHRCTAKVAGVVVVRGLGGGPSLYLGVCKRHLRDHGRAPSDVLATFELPADLLRRIREDYERKSAAERAQEEASRP